MNYNETVDKVMELLKEKEVCFNSQKSHRDYNLAFNCQIYPHIGSVSGFSDENRRALDKITDVTMPADKFYKSVTPFIKVTVVPVHVSANFWLIMVMKAFASSHLQL